MMHISAGGAAAGRGPATLVAESADPRPAHDGDPGGLRLNSALWDLVVARTA